MIYEYACKSCGETVQLTSIGATTHLVRDEDGERDCGPLRRLWTANIAWPHNQRGH
jgi:hypothetical protein